MSRNARQKANACVDSMACISVDPKASACVESVAFVSVSLKASVKAKALARLRKGSEKVSLLMAGLAPALRGPYGDRP